MIVLIKNQITVNSISDEIWIEVYHIVQQNIFDVRQEIFKLIEK